MGSSTKPAQSSNGTWNRTSIRTILLNPRIAGLSAYRGEIVGHGDWEPLVSEETWRAVHALVWSRSQWTEAAPQPGAGQVALRARTRSPSARLGRFAWQRWHGQPLSAARQPRFSVPPDDEGSSRTRRTWGWAMRMKSWAKKAGVPTAAAALALLGILAAAAPARADTIWGQWPIRAATGKCIEVVPNANGDLFAVGNRIQQRTCDGSPQQQWQFVQIPGDFQGFAGNPRFHLVNAWTGQCLDDTDGRTNDRNPVQQWACSPTSNSMVWGFGNLSEDPLGLTLWNEHAPGKCLDVTDGSVQDGARLQIYHCFDSGNLAQHFAGFNGLP